LLLVVALAAVAVRHLHGRGAPRALAVAPIRVAAKAAAGTRARAAPALVVDVEGAVRRPGLVRLASGARVADAVEQAGGVTRLADRSAVNLAAPVSDGQQVLVPRRGPPTAAGAVPSSGSGGAGSGAAASGPLSLSSATPEQLDTLPGVGPVTAQKIVDYRTEHGAFHSVEELDAIPGIGPARLADLKGLVVP
jgi:competence protein ComEA